MSEASELVNVYLDTVKRMEPDISFIDASAFYASAAISLKRVADAQELTANRVLYISLSVSLWSGFWSGCLLAIIVRHLLSP